MHLRSNHSLIRLCQNTNQWLGLWCMSPKLRSQELFAGSHYLCAFMVSVQINAPICVIFGILLGILEKLFVRVVFFGVPSTADQAWKIGKTMSARATWWPF